MAGLILGKVIGIAGTIYLAVKTKIAALPSNATPVKIIGVGFLGGIGFTMSVFISMLAFKEPEFQTAAKVSIITASVVAGLIGYFILRIATSKSERSLFVDERAAKPEVVTTESR